MDGHAVIDGARQTVKLVGRYSATGQLQLEIIRLQRITTNLQLDNLNMANPHELRTDASMVCQAASASSTSATRARKTSRAT